VTHRRSQDIVRITSDNHFVYSLLGTYYHHYNLAVTALDRYGNESQAHEL
jgi:hypothetical protein